MSDSMESEDPRTKETPLAPTGLETGALLLNKYRVERLIGRGGMGCVAAVRHVDLGELFAMKVLLPEIAQRPGAVERFVREARAAARLKSDHVVRVVDVGTLDTGSPYLVMEYLEGKDLATLLEERGTLSPRQVVDFTLEALDAISEAHANGIIHRDLKPSNLFVSVRKNQQLLLKVLDFGISKELNPRDQATTHSAGLMGSPYYMSPEHMRSAKRVDARTDVWSLGIIMYELLSGTIPFDGETPTEVCSAVLEQPLPSLLERAPHVPLELVTIVERCLRRSADERFASSAELAAALKTVSDELVEAPKSLLASGSWLQARVSLTSIPRDITPSAVAPRSSRPSLSGPRAYGADMPTMPPPADAGEDAPPATRSNRPGSGPPSSDRPSLRAPSLEPWGSPAHPSPKRTRWWIGGAAGIVVALAILGGVMMRSPNATREVTSAAASTGPVAAVVTPASPSTVASASPTATATAPASASASSGALDRTAPTQTHATPRQTQSPTAIPPKPNTPTPPPTEATGPALKRPKF
ncbi:MAG: protein kinase [Polyangiaceae bacterium]